MTKRRPSRSRYSAASYLRMEKPILVPLSTLTYSSTMIFYFRLFNCNSLSNPVRWVANIGWLDEHLLINTESGELDLAGFVFSITLPWCRKLLSYHSSQWRSRFDWIQPASKEDQTVAGNRWAFLLHSHRGYIGHNPTHRTLSRSMSFLNQSGFHWCCFAFQNNFESSNVEATDRHYNR